MTNVTSSITIFTYVYICVHRFDWPNTWTCRYLGFPWETLGAQDMLGEGPFRIGRFRVLVRPLALRSQTQPQPCPSACIVELRRGRSWRSIPQSVHECLWDSAHGAENGMRPPLWLLRTQAWYDIPSNLLHFDFSDVASRRHFTVPVLANPPADNTPTNLKCPFWVGGWVGGEQRNCFQAWPNSVRQGLHRKRPFTLLLRMCTSTLLHVSHLLVTLDTRVPFKKLGVTSRPSWRIFY